MAPEGIATAAVVPAEAAEPAAAVTPAGAVGVAGPPHLDPAGLGLNAAGVYR